MSLRKAINGKCKDCIYDDLAAGTCLQQITLCSSDDCPLFDVRPQSKFTIPEKVLSYYGIKTGTFQQLSKNSITDTENHKCSAQVVKLGTSQGRRT